MDFTHPDPGFIDLVRKSKESRSRPRSTCLLMQTNRFLSVTDQLHAKSKLRERRPSPEKPARASVADIDAAVQALCGRIGVWNLASSERRRRTLTLSWRCCGDVPS